MSGRPGSPTAVAMPSISSRSTSGPSRWLARRALALPAPTAARTTLAVDAGQWVVLSLTFLPIFLSSGILLAAGVVVSSALLMTLMFGYSQDEFHDLPTAIGWLDTLV